LYGTGDDDYDDADDNDNPVVKIYKQIVSFATVNLDPRLSNLVTSLYYLYRKLTAPN